MKAQWGWIVSFVSSFLASAYALAAEGFFAAARNGRLGQFQPFPTVVKTGSFRRKRMNAKTNGS
jgi:hypothetical protein